MLAGLGVSSALCLALEFLRAYNEPKVMRELKKQLILPGGLAWIWWEVRTNFAAPAKIKSQLGRLREAIGKIEPYRFAPAMRSRKSRLPSITCQVMRPGIPIARSPSPQSSSTRSLGLRTELTDIREKKR